jgi:hypothetical protein
LRHAQLWAWWDADESRHGLTRDGDFFSGGGGGGASTRELDHTRAGQSRPLDEIPGGVDELGGGGLGQVEVGAHGDCEPVLEPRLERGRET